MNAQPVTFAVEEDKTVSALLQAPASARACYVPDRYRRTARSDYLGRRIYPDGAVVSFVSRI